MGAWGGDRRSIGVGAWPLCCVASVVSIGCSLGAAEREPNVDAEIVPPMWTNSGVDRTLAEAVSLDVLGSFDPVPFEALTVTSYDRSSIAPDQPGWFANHDWTGRVGASSDGYVLFDETGPGVVTRIWSANPSGRVRFYFDDETVPRWDFDAVDLLQGRTSLAHPPFAGLLAQASTLRWPIPFAKRLRITATDPAFYYQIDYRRFAQGTDVGEAVDEPGHASLAKDAYLAIVRGARSTPATSRVVATDLAADSASRLVISADAAGSEIVALSAHLEFATPGDLEQTVLRIAFDGEPTVFVPIARFFLFDPSGSRVDSLPISADPTRRDVVSRFRMPFATEAVIDLVAPPGTELVASFEARVRARAVSADDLRFHAHWTGPIVVDSAVKRDLRFVVVNGRGRYVGTSLRVGNPSRPGWWGEGDEKIWIDDSSFPARFGTGTEDYYGYAFCSSERFSTPWIGLFRSNLEDFGGIIELYRFHLDDAMSFESSFVFDQEVYHWDSDFDVHNMLDFDAVSYLYAASDAAVISPWDEAIPHAPMQIPSSFLVPMGSGIANCR